MLIIFEGADKTGKTTLLRKLLKETNYKHVVYDRGPISQIVFDICFGRITDPQLFNVVGSLVLGKNLLVLCQSNKEDIEARLDAANESLPRELSDIDKVQRFFEELSKKSGFNVLKINTSEYNVNECIDLILKEIDRIENDRDF